MDLKSDFLLPVLGFAATVTSALCFYLGSGLQPWAWAMWVAPLPLLVFAARGRRDWPAAVTGFVAFALGGLNLWPYLSVTLHLPLPVRVLAVVGPALWFALATWIWRWLLARGRAWGATFGLPAAWIASEGLMAHVSPHGTFGSIAYTQMDFLSVIQLAALAGPVGVSFAVLLPASALGVLAAPQVAPKDKRRIGTAVAALFAVLVGWGAARLGTATEGGPTVAIGLAASSDPQHNLPADGTAGIAWLREHAKAADEFARAGAQCVVLPENLAWIDASSSAVAEAAFREVAVARQTAIVVGWARREGPMKWNEAALFLPDGGVSRYAKQHLLPGLEGEFTAGDRALTAVTDAGLTGVAICKDLDFTGTSRDYGARGVALLLVPAWDFVVDDWLHARMAVLRGVDGGFMIARASRQGLLSVSDAWGRVIVAQRATGDGFTKLIVRVTPTRRATLYQRWGDWLVWVSAGAVVGLLAASRRRFS